MVKALLKEMTGRNQRDQVFFQATALKEAREHYNFCILRSTGIIIILTQCIAIIPRGG